jgi:hypothetical protein
MTTGRMKPPPGGNRLRRTQRKRATASSGDSTEPGAWNTAMRFAATSATGSSPIPATSVRSPLCMTLSTAALCAVPRADAISTKSGESRREIRGANRRSHQFNSDSSVTTNMIVVTRPAILGGDGRRYLPAIASHSSRQVEDQNSMVGEMITAAARIARGPAACAAHGCGGSSQQAQNGINSGHEATDTDGATLKRREIPRKNRREW